MKNNHMLEAISSVLYKTDSYKLSHWMQFPEGMEESEYYIESRGGEFDGFITAGLAYITKVLEQQLTVQDVTYARAFYNEHFGADYFNFEGFMDIVENHNGYLPVTIRAVDEGILIPVKNPVMIVRTAKGFGWLAGYLETMLLRAVWYPSTVATISYNARKVIHEAMVESCDLPEEEAAIIERFRLHDFGSRGSTSGESAAIGGLAHLYSFWGSDTVEAIRMAEVLFPENKSLAGFSIPAREHSTTTCYLREGEYDAFMNSVENFGGGLFAVVIDSYSTTKALEWLTTNEKFLQVLTEKGGTCVLRPDSGIPVDMILLCLEAVAKNVGLKYNSKGYKVLDKRFRVIQGDGIDLEEIRRIINGVVGAHRYSMENFAFGMGGGLLQQCNRDTGKWAMKCSAMKINGEWRDVFKAPETDLSKKSKAGRLDTIKQDEVISTVVLEDNQEHHPDSIMKVVFENGHRLNILSLSQIRSNIDKQI